MPTTSRAKVKIAIPAGSPNGRWLELVAEVPLRPIRSGDDLGRAIAMTHRLIVLDELTAEEEDYLHILGDLIHAYEERTLPDDVTPSDMLRYLLDLRGVSQADVARATGISEATLSHILSGHRPPSRKAIEALAPYFKVDPGVFL
jgi:HTH-type transcriptional regulator / antitoxin HigA